MNEISVLKDTELLGRQFTVYGTPDEPLFKAADVAAWLSLTNVSDMVQRVDADEVTKLNLGSQSGEAWFLTEDGLYEVLMQSRKPIARQFKKEVKKILKEIRMTGGYMATKADDTPELIMARAVMLAQDTIHRYAESNRMLKEDNIAKDHVIDQQNKELKVARPKVDFYDTIMGRKDTVEMKDVAKMLDMGIGRNNLFKFLREQKVVDRRNVPYQLYVDKRWFKSVPVYFDDPQTGLPSMYLKTVVYPAGLDGIRQMLISKGFKKNVGWEQNATMSHKISKSK